MERLQTNVLPQTPPHLFQIVTGHLNILYLNIGNMQERMDDIKEDELLKFADVISINETHLSESDILTPNMMNLTEDPQVFQKDRNIYGGGVALLIHQSLSPEPIIIKTDCEVVAVKISLPSEMIIISAYRPSSTPICVFTQEMSEIITLFDDMPISVMGDFNEDILHRRNITVRCSGLKDLDKLLLSIHMTVEH